VNKVAMGQDFCSSVVFSCLNHFTTAPFIFIYITPLPAPTGEVWEIEKMAALLAIGEKWTVKYGTV
jgi:hypothetical protein